MAKEYGWTAPKVLMRFFGRGASVESVSGTARSQGAPWGHPISNVRKGFRSAALGLLALVAVPAAASANCEVPFERHDFIADRNGKLDIVDHVARGTVSSLNNAGIDIGGAYYAEPFYNWGGLNDGGEYQGVLELYVNADMKKLGLWDGLCFHADGFQIHGNSITGANIGGLMPVTSFEALPATRLFELWLEQHLFNDTVSVKVGQLAADAEFFFAEGGGYFINGTWGWAPIAAENNPGGGPAYPLATPGVRVALAPTEQTNLKIGVYNGNPAPNCAAGDPQECNPDGLDFGLRDNALLMAEGSYSYTLGGGELPGTIKVGGWNHFGSFEHLYVDAGGNPIAISGNSGKPLDNDYALYVILDQLLWHAPGTEEGQGLGFFTRFAGAPDDRNYVDFYFDVGLTLTGMIPGRPNDALAIGYAYTSISNKAQAFNVTNGDPAGEGYEALIEIAYTMEVMDGWTLQPDFQYIMNPDGGVEADNATVVGARSTFAF